MKRKIAFILACLMLLCAEILAASSTEPSNREIGAHLSKKGPVTFTIRGWTVEFTEQGYDGIGTSRSKDMNCPLIIGLWDVRATDSASEKTVVNYEASMTECGTSSSRSDASKKR